MNRIAIKLLTITLVLVLTACPQKDEQAQDKPPGDNSSTHVEYIHVGPNWAALQKLDTKKSQFELNTSIKKVYKIGEEITMTVKSERTGKLWVVFVDPNDEVTLMFPNKQDADNTIKAKQLITLPESIDSGWAVRAGEPLGQSIVSFILTTGDVDLSQVLSTNNENTVSKALSMVDTSNQWAIQTHVVSVIENNGDRK